MTPFALYIHIPYCLQRCPYCDFNAYAVAKIPQKEYVSALLSELDYRANQPAWQGRDVRSIYFGGGTPSLFEADAIGKIIAGIAGSFPVCDELEVSLEANPGALAGDFLYALRQQGVNRLSIGAQSFNQSALEILGRVHTVADITVGVETARAAGFRNLSLDLIFGTPQQRKKEFLLDIDRTLELEPEHISTYGLTIEKGTPFFQMLKRGAIKLPSEGTVVQMIDSLRSVLPQRGYDHYEISNYAKPGREAQHNLAYWNGDDYLGLGAGAHSFVLDRSRPYREVANRWANYADPERYMKTAVAHGHAHGWEEGLKMRDLVFEFFFLGLRKTSGVCLQQFKAWFGFEAQQIYGNLFEVLAQEELIIYERGRLHLTDRGLLLADSVIHNFSDIPSRLPRSKAAEDAPEDARPAHEPGIEPVGAS